MSNVSQATSNFQQKFSPEAAKGLDVVFQFNISDADNFYLVIKDSICTLVEGDNEDANVVLVADSQTLLDLSDGSLDGMQAFMAGKLRIEGDMMLSMKLHELFPV